MKFTELQVGRRVQVGSNGYCGRSDLKGMIGKIVAVEGGAWEVGVEFNKPICGGHSCRGRGKDGYCYYGYAKDIFYIDNVVDIKSLAITFDDIAFES